MILKSVVSIFLLIAFLLIFFKNVSFKRLFTSQIGRIMVNVLCMRCGVFSEHFKQVLPNGKSALHTFLRGRFSKYKRTKQLISHDLAHII